jgi:hypothetical protein
MRNMRKQFFTFLTVITITFFSCQTDTQQDNNNTSTISPMERLPQNEAGEIVRKAIEFVGGWEAWGNKNNFSFYKNITHLDSTGQVERTQKQLHQYQIHPHFKARMSWEDKGKKYLIINNGKEAKKYEDGKEMTDENSKKQAWNSSYGSNYVISMPFKLTDPGVILTYEGIDSTTLKKRVHALKVEYKKGAGSSGGMHIWWYYFDEKNYDLVANFLDYGNGYSLTTYETFTKVDGMRIHEKRFSHISKSKNEIVQLRTIYENEKMEFDQDFDESLFDLK